MFIKLESNGDKMDMHVTIEWKKLIAFLKAVATVIGIIVALYSTQPVQYLLKLLGF